MSGLLDMALDSHTLVDMVDDCLPQLAPNAWAEARAAPVVNLVVANASPHDICGTATRIQTSSLLVLGLELESSWTRL